MSGGLQEGLRGFLDRWQFVPPDDAAALEELLTAIRQGDEDTVRLVITDKLSRGQLRQAQAILSKASRDIKRATPVPTAQLQARRDYQAAYQRKWQAKRKAELALAKSIIGGE